MALKVVVEVHVTHNLVTRISTVKIPRHDISCSIISTKIKLLWLFSLFKRSLSTFNGVFKRWLSHNILTFFLRNDVFNQLTHTKMVAKVIILLLQFVPILCHLKVVFPLLLLCGCRTFPYWHDPISWACFRQASVSRLNWVLVLRLDFVRKFI